jgi:hypothetical protein
MRKYLLVFLAMLSLSVPVLSATPAAANAYPGLHVQDWISPYNDVLRARITIEVNDQNQGRYRFRIICYYYDANGRLIDQQCLMGPGTHIWKDLTTGETFSRSPGDVTAHDYTWTGQYRTLQNDDTYAVKAQDFLVYFYHSNYVSQKHTICSYKVTWHTGGSPTIGGLWC